MPDAIFAEPKLAEIYDLLALFGNWVGQPPLPGLPLSLS